MPEGILFFLSTVKLCYLGEVLVLGLLKDSLNF